MPVKQTRPVAPQFGPNGLALLESHHHERFHMDWRSDTYDKILILIGGEGVFHWNSTPIALLASAVLVIPAQTRHRIEDTSGRPISLYGICIHRSRCAVRQLAKVACSRVRSYSREQEREFWKPETLDEVSRRLGLSRRRFTQLFAELTGEILAHAPHAPAHGTRCSAPARYPSARAVSRL